MSSPLYCTHFAEKFSMAVLAAAVDGFRFDGLETFTLPVTRDDSQQSRCSIRREVISI